MGLCLSARTGPHVGVIMEKPLKALFATAVFMAIIFSGRLSGGHGATQTSSAPPGYELVWSDEFNGPDGAVPDVGKWAYDIGGDGWGNHELEFYTNHAQNAQMKAGNLVITAQKETTVTPKGETRLYTSARIRTQGLFSTDLRTV